MKSSSLRHITLFIYDEFPLYSIIVPDYKESEVLPSLLYNLFELNYPKDKLQILIVLKADDKGTILTAKILSNIMFKI